jgi:hypothetical protein
MTQRKIIATKATEAKKELPDEDLPTCIPRKILLV